VVANLENDAARLREELEQVQADLQAVGPEAEELAAEEESFAEHRRSVLATINDVTASVTAASAAAEVRGELRSMQSGVARAESEARRLESRVEALRQRSERLEQELIRLRALCDESQVTEAPLVAEVENAETRRISAEAASDVATLARQSAAEEMSRWKARADALQLALEAARARAGAEHLAGVPGALGTLLDLVEIDEDWQPAVEAALGDALLAVVVDDPAAGRRALNSLRESNVNGAVLALGLASVTHPVASPLGGHRVRPHVRSSRPEVEQLLDVILAAAVRADSWAEAVDLAIAAPGAVVVTADGDRFGPSGWRLGAAGGGTTAAALDEAVQRLEQAQGELGRQDQAVQVTRAELQAARQHEQELTRRLDQHDAGFTASSEKLAQVQGERRETTVELESGERALVEAIDRVDRERARINELESLVPALEADEAAEAAAARARGELRARLDSQAAVLASQRQELSVRNAGLHEREQFLERRLAETETRLTADSEARMAAAERRREVERSLQAIERLAGLVEGHRLIVETRHNELAEIRRRQSDEVRRIATRLDDVRRRRTAAEKQLDETRERSRRVEVDEAEARMRLEAAVESLRRDHDVEPEVAERAQLPALPEGVGAAARVRDLERELRLLGPINPLALEEFNELQERHTFLQAQLDDVRDTRRELLRVIKAVDLEIQTVFAAAFADVSMHFTQLFSGLFPGGVGKLVLTNPDDLLNTGIEVEAKPSGKNVKKLSLLSGGERSLTALAYLFAVFRSRPSPFYVMDEVEAALDDVNLHRFLGLVGEFRREAQLLIVSHQKRTMEAGDCLLGVTMQPGGSSKVVTERVSTSA
jgi:chromosome segregation protein